MAQARAAPERVRVELKGRGGGGAGLAEHTVEHFTVVSLFSVLLSSLFCSPGHTAEHFSCSCHSLACRPGSQSGLLTRFVSKQVRRGAHKRFYPHSVGEPGTALGKEVFSYCLSLRQCLRVRSVLQGTTLGWTPTTPTRCPPTVWSSSSLSVFPRFWTPVSSALCPSDRLLSFCQCRCP